MKISLPSGLPVLAVFICALLLTVAPVSLHAEPAENGAVSDTSNPSGVTPGAPAFQGLMPPAGSAVIMPVPSTDSATDVKAEAVPAQAEKSETPVPTTTVRYGETRPDGEETHPTLNLTPDKAEMVRLETDAGTVIVGNPDNLSIQLENRRLLILSPHQPGATYITILDDGGKVLMQRHVVVASAKNNYVRIRRSCTGQENCQSSTVYYCPGMCHAVNTTQGGQSTNAALPSGAISGTPAATPAVTSTTPPPSTTPIEPDSSETVEE